jgi:hypothetical protein
MTKFVEYWFNFPIISDLPARVPEVIDILMNEEKPSSDVELPEHDWFKIDNWYLFNKQMVHDSNMSCDLERTDNNLHISGCVETDDAGIVLGFIDWIYPYIKTSKEQRFLGFYRRDIDAFPNILMQAKSSFALIKLDGIFNSDSPIIIDPSKKSVTKLPSFDEMRETLESLLDKDKPDVDA